jgi:ATP-dependent DNA helicase RecG
MDLTSPVIIIPGVGTALQNKLSKLGVNSVFDLLYHLPARYEDRRLISPVGKLQPGETATAIGTLIALKNEFSHKGRFMQVGKIEDVSGSITVIWFNQSYLTRALKIGTKIALWGKIDFYKNTVAFISPDYEIPGVGELLHMGRIVPVYPETAGISSKWLRTKIYRLLGDLQPAEILPESFGLMEWKKALQTIHFPENLDSVPVAKNRLAFDELFLLQLASLIRKQVWHDTRLSHPLKVDQEKVMNFIGSLPFTLTPAQNQAIKEILTDLNRTSPMNRLLEGDVGSGKTVVAAVAALVAYLNGFRTIILAPTQILANQHYQTFSSLFKPLGLEIGLITGSKKISSKQYAVSSIIIGTHAVLAPGLEFKDVGLVIIDEQHRFGVSQRSQAAKLGESPHILTMTATPIPRTIALTMYGDLDVSVLDTKPLGRLRIKTWVVPAYKREASYKWINDQITKYASQAFWVCPLINDSETLTSVKAVTAEYENLKKIFPNFRLGLLHGRLKSKEKDEVMAKFRNGDYQILVATPVVEVGLDIPNATLMVIEGAERFGLAQLHQFRGRVGRNNIQSYCLLFTSEDSGMERLKALETFDSGLDLAETDLKLRGPGEIYGTAQHGFPEFKVATYSDLSLIETARKAAVAVLPRLETYPLLRRLVKEDKIHIIEPN